VSVGRRKLLLYTLGGVTAGAGAVIGTSEYYARKNAKLVLRDGPGYALPSGAVEQRRTLGRTGIEVGVVGIGAGGLNGTAPILRAVDKGMTYIDTSRCYGDSELVIGRAIRESPRLKDQLVIATKWDSGAKMPKDRILASLDESLKRLGVDKIDVMQIHWLGGGHMETDDGFNRLDNPELYEAMEIAKSSGKVRFFGATSHDKNRAKILEHAIDKGVFDVLLVKMNVLDFEGAGMPTLLAKAKAKNVGVVAMKSQPGGSAIPKGYEDSRYNIYQANLRWTLEHDIACVVHSAIGTDDHVQDLAVGAVEQRFGANDARLLDRYARALSPEYCRACGACEDACPDGVRVGSVLQFAMYAKQYGWEDAARAHYASLPAYERWSEACLSCSRCNAACPYGVDAQGRVVEARKILA
jgi:predicted aldo/keto reductase-like oxidoreductase